MNIIIFSESYAPIINGVSISTAILRNGLLSRGHNVYVFTPKHPNQDNADTNTIRTPSFITSISDNYPIPFPLIERKLYEKFKSFSPDIVLSQIPFILGKTASNWCKNSNICHVSMNHTLYADYVHYVPLVPKAIASKEMERYIKNFYNKCDAVATPSEMMKKTLINYGVKNEISVIPTGIEMPPVKDEEKITVLKKSLGIEKNDTVMVYVSRLAKEKNPDLMLDSFEILAKKHPSLKFLIVGGGHGETYIRKRVASSGIGNKIIITGMVEKSQIYNYLFCGDIFVFPSYTETQGLAVCEALAAGLPVVAVNAGGVPENIEDGITGFLTSNSKEKFAEKIDLLILDKIARKTMSENAEKSASMFSIADMINKYETFFTHSYEKHQKLKS